MKIETQFINAMKQVFPNVGKEAPQYKMSRLIFYMGAMEMVFLPREKDETLEDLKKSVDQLKGALKFASAMSEKGIQPEDALAEYVENDDK